MTIDPTPEQLQIIETDKESIVTANPGTGKTTTLALKVIQLLENGINPDEILCITFTKKARDEMYDSIFEHVDSKHYSKVKNIHIHTFHSFAHEYLVDNGLISSVINDDNLLRFSIFSSLTKNGATHHLKNYIISDVVPNTANAIKYIKSFGITPEMIDAKKVSVVTEKIYSSSETESALEELKAFTKYLTYAYYEYEKTKKDSIDYTDMLIKFLDKYDQKKYEYVLVDEMQDMNEMESNIVKKVAQNIILVGDKKQAIFGFQGGSTKHVERFRGRCKSMELLENWRSTSEILDYAKQHYLRGVEIDEAEKSNLLNLKSTRGSGNKPIILETRNWLSNILQTIKDSPEKDIGVLARTNEQVSEISRYFDKHDIKHTSTSAKKDTVVAKIEIIKFLAGLLYDDMDKKIRAAWTIFSPYTLREADAFSTAQQKRAEQDNNNKLKELESWDVDLKFSDLDMLFKSVILPICISKGEEWFVAAVSIKENMEDYLDKNTPVLDEMFDYLAICEEPQVEPRSKNKSNDDYKDKKITVSSIHKAKGREFGMVIYIPKNVTKTSIYDKVKRTILQSLEINVQDEIKQEYMRQHFVALTRAKNELVVITDRRNIKEFIINDDDNDENIVNVVHDDADKDPEVYMSTTNSTDNMLAEAYSLFVQGRVKESQEALKKSVEGVWIENKIADYFKEMDRISYSKINTSPPDFMQNNIIGVNTYTAKSSSDFGTIFHDKIHKILKGDANAQNITIQDYDNIVDNYEGDAQGGDNRRISFKEKLEIAIKNAQSALDEIGAKYPGWQIHALEKKYDVPIKEMTEYDTVGGNIEELVFVGKIDAVFKHNAGYVIIDYKTSSKKDSNKTTSHNKQVTAYKRMLSRAENIPEDVIETYIIYPSVTGSINTGKIEYVISKTKRNVYSKFEEDLQKVLGWKQDYKKFIDDLLKDNKPAYKKDTSIVDKIKEKLMLLRSANQESENLQDVKDA